MKKTKIIVPALGMLLLSTAASVTGTVAWFAVNGTVTANGMQVAAKTDNAYLIIKEGTTLSGNATTATASLDEQLYPVHPFTTLTTANIETLGSWGTASSTDPNDANVSAELTALTAPATLDSYVATAQFTVGILANSGSAAADLKLDSLTISDVNDGITVVVTCGTNIYSHNSNVAAGGSEVLAVSSAVNTTGVLVKVYIYIDGANENVKTSNAENLGGTVSMTFKI